MASIPSSTWVFSPTRINTPFSSSKAVLFLPPKHLKSFKPLLASSGDGTPEEQPEASDPVKLAFSKGKAYLKSKSSRPIAKQNPVPDSTGKTNESGNTDSEVPASVKLAMEKAKAYKKNKGSVLGSGIVAQEKRSDLGQEELKLRNSVNKVSKKEESKISRIDFLGLGFSEKKEYRGMPPGLNPVIDPFLEGDSPEVELIVGDASKFEATTPSEMSSNEDDNNVDLYKPKVSTWGVFPRPSNISKTFGGGKVIRPGELLETEEDKAAKEARSRELISAYKSTMGLKIDAKKKAECVKALMEGDSLMDLGKLREALPYYEKVMKDLVFQSELHGLAALQWSVCQDSLCRPNEARVMYEKLQSHPNVQVSKKARQFVFGFQAMEMMKITSSSISKKTGYENYFEAFVEDKANYTPTEEEKTESALTQGLPYIIFLLSPVFIVLFIALRKSFLS